MYRIAYTKTFEKDLNRLDPFVAKKIIIKIAELGSGSINFQPLKYTPKGLEKLCKLKIGDWRVLFCVDHNAKMITLYTVEHRGKIYRHLK